MNTASCDYSFVPGDQDLLLLRKDYFSIQRFLLMSSEWVTSVYWKQCGQNVLGLHGLNVRLDPSHMQPVWVVQGHVVLV